MLVRDKKTGRYLSQKQSDKIIAKETELYKQKVTKEVKKSHDFRMLLLYGLIVVLIIALLLK